MKFNSKYQQLKTMFAAQRGISILFAVAILSVILSIALGTNIILIRQVKTMREADYSVIAFYAAESEIEKALMTKDQEEGVTSGVLLLPSGAEAEYEVSVLASTTDPCQAANYCITSIGSYKNTRRAIEVMY